MNCCINCFNNKTLHYDIHYKNTLGNCEFCDSTNIHIYTTEDLSELFVPLFDLYEEDQDGVCIYEALYKDFYNNIFSSHLGVEKIEQLLNSIIENDETLKNKFQDKKVRLITTSNTGEELLKTWNEFSNEIKFKNRFHFENQLDLKSLKKIFTAFSLDLRRGRHFYRARISKDKKGFEINELGAPPSLSATNGRVNPNGISYLYVSESIETTLYETRASLLDYVTIGKFKLNKDIKVVNLDLDKYDVFEMVESDLLESFINYRDFLLVLKNAISKSKRPSESDLEYLPIQYITEFIKSLGFDGVYFSSTLHKDGKNLVLFDQNLFSILNKKNIDIQSVLIEYSEIDNEE